MYIYIYICMYIYMYIYICMLWHMVHGNHEDEVDLDEAGAARCAIL